MKTLWFRTSYKADILAGRKTDTIRPRSARLPKLGERVGFSIGARPIFAVAVVTAIEPVSDLPADRRAQLLALYEGKMPDDPVRISFRLERRA